ncbi:unnamed protein product [Prunus armeniaca]
MLQLNVSDFLEKGLWDIACLQECLPPDIVFMITSFMLASLIVVLICSFGGLLLMLLLRLRPSFGCFVTKSSLLMLKGTVEFGSWFEESSGLYPNFDDWLFHNMHSKRSFMTGLAWNLVFTVSLWFIWKWRFYLHWQAPLPGRCKVNSDGSRKHALGYIRAGVIEAELWGIFWELHLAWEAGFRSVEVECDSKSVVGLLLNPPSHTHPL